MERADYERQYEGRTLAFIPEFNERVRALGVANEMFAQPYRVPELERGQTQVLHPVGTAGTGRRRPVSTGGPTRRRTPMSAPPPTRR